MQFVGSLAAVLAAVAAVRIGEIIVQKNRRRGTWVTGFSSANNFLQCFLIAIVLLLNPAAWYNSDAAFLGELG